MRHTVHKLFCVWDFDKEEKWLNEMSARGMQLAAVGFCKYLFDDGEPGGYCVRLELLDNWPTRPESEKYIRFVEDTGAQYLGSVLRWVYFRKKASEGGFDLFSDIDSRIRHLKRIFSLVGLLGVLVLCSGAYNGLFGYLRSGRTADLISGILGLLLGILLAFGFVRIYRKFLRLKKERTLHE